MVLDLDECGEYAPEAQKIMLFLAAVTLPILKIIHFKAYFVMLMYEVTRVIKF